MMTVVYVMAVIQIWTVLVYALVVQKLMNVVNVVVMDSENTPTSTAQTIEPEPEPEEAKDDSNKNLDDLLDELKKKTEK